MKPSKLIRRTHMYLALFLTPWLIIYALSGLVLNHAKLFLRPDGQLAMPFEKVEMRDYKAVFSADADARMIGNQVLEDLGLSGTFNTQGNPHEPKLVINRNGAFAIHRITYFREQGRLLVEKQPLRTPTFLNRTHFRHGYDQAFVSAKIWALIVDLVAVALLFWVISGVWMWWEIKPARLWGGVFGLIGLGIFGILLATI